MKSIVEKLKGETVKDAKEALKLMLSQLERYDENLPLELDLDDNSGGSYLGAIKDFSVDVKGRRVIITNY
jgi:hypothetical protein